MAETTTQTISRLEKSLATREAKLITAKAMLGSRHKICKSRALAIETIKELIAELKLEVQS